MILTSSKNRNVLLIAATLFVLQFLPLPVSAQGLELSVTPTLFEMAAVPDQKWSSQVKVINSNSYPLTVYAEVVNFAPKGEAGEGSFLPVFEEFTEGATLAEWVTIEDDAIIIPPETSATVPFTVRVPEDASPGGHFAAIMIGTRPPADGTKMKISTSQIVTSLFFVRVAGDVIEDGVIREFSTQNRFVGTPAADFTLRFENRGNVHIQPQGDIQITNMWGRERGVVPINAQTHFGNVLPESIRRFEFGWEGNLSLMDIGRYKAVATLGYGLDQRQFQTSTTHFYVIPFKAISIFLVGLVITLLFISWCIRLYVRRMLELSGVDMRLYKTAKAPVIDERPHDVRLDDTKTSVQAPLLQGVRDLRASFANVHKISDAFTSAVSFVARYRLFFIALLGASGVLAGIVYFVMVNRTSEVAYNVTITTPEAPVELSSEEIIYNQQAADRESTAAVTDRVIETATTTQEDSQLYQLEIMNSSDTIGLAAETQQILESEDYGVAKIGSDFEEVKRRSVVVFTAGYENEALELSELLGGALLSVRPENEEGAVPLITVFIGNDFELP